MVESHDTVYRSGKARICCCNKRPLTLGVSEQQRFLSGSRFITPITGQRRLCSRLSSVLGSRVRLRGSPKLGCCRAHVKGKTRSERITRRLPRLLPGREEAHVASAHMSLTKTSPMAQPSARGAEKMNPPPPGEGAWAAVFTHNAWLLRLEPRRVFLGRSLGARCRTARRGPKTSRDNKNGGFLGPVTPDVVLNAWGAPLI